MRQFVRLAKKKKNAHTINSILIIDDNPMLRVILFVFLSAFSAADSLGPFRGVNIGGWLVLESWITPQLYQDNNVTVSSPLLPGAPPSNGPGEWGFCAALGKERCSAVLQTHWDTWISRSELQTLASSGINWLRVPVGYWIVDIGAGEPFVDGGMFYLRRLLTWAEELGLSVLVDLHAAPGSQNGHDNSGRTGPIQWSTPANIDRTVKDLVLIATQLSDLPAFKALELLNEPWTTFVGGSIQISTLMQFYQTAYTAVRSSGFAGAIVMSDGFAPDDVWNGFMPPPQYTNVFLDVHLYRCFGGGPPSPWANVDAVCQQTAPRLGSLTQRDWTIVGEFSLCLTNATIAQTGSFNKFSAMFMQAQLTAFGAATASGPVKGGFFWNFKIQDYNVTNWNSTRLMWDYLLNLSLDNFPTSSNQWSSIDGCP